jgi:hypothetical protein
VTLTEEGSGYVWVAEVWHAQSNDREVAIVSAPKLPTRAADKREFSVALSRRLVWSQAGEILDFVVLTSNGPTANVVVLEPERIAFYSGSGSQWQFNGLVPISHTSVWPRDLSGGIDPESGKVTIGGAACVGDVVHPDGLHCDQLHGHAARLTDANQIRMPIEDRAGDVVNLGTVCAGLGSLLLASGTSDWTQADHLRIYDAAAQAGLPIGQPLEIPGPVLALGVTAEGKSARVVSRNLQTGMYEASIVTVSCGN